MRGGAPLGGALRLRDRLRRLSAGARLVRQPAQDGRHAAARERGALTNGAVALREQAVEVLERARASAARGVRSCDVDGEPREILDVADRPADREARVEA